MNNNISYNQYQPNFAACRLESLKKGLKEYVEGYPKRIAYTAKHKKAFLKVEKELTGRNTLSGYLHDLGKLIAYILGVPQKIAHIIHVSTASHHVRNGKIKNPEQAVIDWECARYTKPDKPQSARDFYEEHYVKNKKMRIPEIEEVMNRFGL